MTDVVSNPQVPSDGDWLSAFDRLVPAPTGWVVVHSSLAHLARDPASVKWPLLRVIRHLNGQGATLAFPSFTLSFCRGVPYHYRRSRSETGVLADWVHELTGALRTRHPIYSFVVVGPRAHELDAQVNETTFGDTSSFAFFEQNNAWLVALGCGLESFSQFHRYEEHVGVPYRYFKAFAGEADYGSGRGPVSATMYVRDLDLNCRTDFKPIVNQLRAEGLVRLCRLGHGELQSTTCREGARVARALLRDDPWALVPFPRKVEYRQAVRQRAANTPPLRIALLGHANLNSLQEQTQQALGAHIPDRRLNIYVPPFGQVTQALLDSRSELNTGEFTATFFVDRLEDLAGQAWLEMTDVAVVEDKVRQHVEALARYRSQRPGWIFVHDFSLLGPTSYGEAEAERAGGVWQLAARLDALLHKRLASLPQVRILNLRSLVSMAGVPVWDDRLWLVGRYPFSGPFNEVLARKYAGLVMAAMGRGARVLLIDLDNTLWGGVLGEDGMEGIEVGGDYPGNCFAAFQSALKALAARGIALAICSKNDEASALAALTQRREMRLKSEDFVAHRINWQPKWKNVLSICQELNLSPESGLFIDDNPVEREQLRQQVPAVRVLDLPDDPALRVAALLREPALECLELTAEDRQRAIAYHARRKSQQLKVKAASLEDFYSSLDVQLHLLPLDQDNLARAVQLLQKTNQFNTTTRRYQRVDLDSRPSHQEVIVIGSKDRFSPFENIGLLILNWGDPAPDTVTVDVYLLSCRVLGKGLERAVLEWVKQRALHRGMREVRGEIVETERNTPVRGIYGEAGFEPMPEAGWWRCLLAGGRIQMPGWLQIKDQTDPPLGGEKGTV
jgi:FkbH-like protein